MNNSDVFSYHVADLWDGESLLGPHRLVAQDGRWVEVEATHRPIEGDIAVDGVGIANLVDLHMHFGRGPYAVRLDALISSGTRAICSQGDAGPDTFEEWRRNADEVEIPTYVALNVAPAGEALVGCLDGFQSAVVNRVRAVVEAQRDRVPMLSVNLSERSLGRADPEEVLAGALKAAERCGLRLMIALAPGHLLPIRHQLAVLRAGDIVTYCFRSRPWCLFPANGPLTSVVDAVQRGVLLDVAHGSQAFDAKVARRAIRFGLLPHVISSGGKSPEPGHPHPPSLISVMERLWALGMQVEKVLLAATTAPAGLLGLRPVDAFRPGMPSSIAFMRRPFVRT